MAGGGILLALAAAGEAVAGGGSLQTAGSEATGRVDPMAWLVVALAPIAVGLFVWRRWYRLADAPRRPPVVSPLTGLILFYAMVLLGMVGAAVVRRTLFGDLSAEELAARPLADQALILFGHYAAQAIAVVGFVWFAGRSSRADPVPAGGPRRAVLIGTGALVLFWPIVQGTAAVAGYVVERASGEPVEPIAHDTLSLLLDSPPDVWLIVVAVLVTVVAPVFEEVMYRGILQSALAHVGLGRWGAILITSGFFALMHVGVARWHALVALFVLSLGLGWVYERTGQLTAAMTMHVLFNAANLALGWLSGPEV